MKNKTESIKAKETFKEFYQVDNDKCPICQKKFESLQNLTKLGSIAYCLTCYTDATNQGINLK